MSTLDMIGAIVLSILSLLIIILVIAQRSKDDNLGSSFGDLGGGFEGTRGNSYEMVLRKYTKWLAIIFAALVVVADILLFVLGK